MLKSALTESTPDYEAMTEDEQIAFALQMSLANDAEAMETATTPASADPVVAVCNSSICL